MISARPSPAAPPSAALAPYTWLVLDVETGNGRPEDAERAMRIGWSPNPTWKAETIGKRFLEMHEKKQERLALLDSSPVLCVALRSDELRCLHSMYAHAPRMEGAGLVEGFATRREMLVALRTLLDARVGPQTQLVGHNLKAFDLRKLRWAYLHERIRMPVAFAAKDQPLFDTMVEYGYRFALKQDLFLGLAEILEDLGLEHHKGLVDGTEVPKLYEAGEFDTIARYALLDVLAESDVYLRMTGQNADEASPPKTSAA